MWVLLVAALLAPPAERCTGQKEPMVAKAETAKAIAEAVLAEKGIRPGGQALFGRWEISVEADSDDRRYWLVFAYDDSAAASGLWFRINRCNGAIRDMRWVH